MTLLCLGACRPANVTLAGVADGLRQSHLSKAKADGTPERARQAANLLAEAERCLGLEDGLGAQQAATDAATICREISDPEGTADAVRVQVLVKRHEERVRGQRPKGSLELASLELKKLAEGKDRQGEAKLMLAVAEVTADPAEALKQATEARTMFKAARDELMEGRALLAIVDIQSQMKERSQEMWQAAMLAQELFTQNNSRTGTALSKHALAGVHAVRDSLDNAIRIELEALNLFKTLGMGSLEALVLESLSRLSLQQSSLDQAVSYSERALAVAKGLQQQSCGLEHSALAAVVEAHVAHRTPARAREAVEGELLRFTAAGDTLGEAAALHGLAKLHLAMDQLPRALTLVEEASGLFAEIGSKGRQIGCLCLATEILMSRGQNDEAMAKAQQAVALSRQAPEEAAPALRMLTQVCVAQGRSEEAMKTAEAECKLHRDQGSLQEEARSMLQACSVHSSSGDFEKVVATAANVQQLLNRAGPSRTEAEAWNAIAQAHLSSERHNAAMFALKQTKKKCQELNDEKQLMAALLSSARATFAQAVQHVEKGGAEDETQRLVQGALDEAGEAIELARSLDDPSQVAAALMTLANAQTLSMMFPEALKSAGEAAEVCRKSGDEWGEGSAHALCAHVQLLCERPGRAGRAVSQAMQLFQQSRDFQAEAWASEFLRAIGEARPSAPAAAFPLGSARGRCAGLRSLGPGLGLTGLLAEDEELDFDPPLLQAGPTAGPRSQLSGALLQRLLEERSSTPGIFCRS